MTKTILITGSTDGIGLLTAQKLSNLGHLVLLHGRNQAKLDAAAATMTGPCEKYVADLSNPQDVTDLARAIRENHARLDVVINNAGVFKTPAPHLSQGVDLRFMVNTFAPWVLTQDLLAIMPRDGRVVNLSSAAQAPIDVDAMNGQGRLDDFAAYAQSKLAITIWTQELARTLVDGPMVVAVNPGSLLASKMVKDGFGVAGNDLSIGADILSVAALDTSFENANGAYFDNDSGRFTDPHAAAQDVNHVRAVMDAIQENVARLF